MTSLERLSQKRQRSQDADSEDPMTPAPIVKSADLWMDDGSIILRTSSDDGRTLTLYKVHKFTLAYHSTFFRDLFDGPQTAFDTASERYDGLPVLDMQDAAQDVDDFLKAIYLPNFTQRHRRLVENNLTRRDFPGMYTGVMRLAKKYDAQHISESIVQALLDEWPTKVERWVVREAELKRQAEVLGAGEEISKVYPDPAHTIHIASEFDIPNVLPIAFYDVARVFELYDPLAVPLPGSPIPRIADLSELAASDLRRLALGRAAMRAHLLKAYAPLRFPPFRGCKGSGSCQPSIDALWGTRVMAMHVSPDPILWIGKTIANGALLDACSVCRGEFVKIWTEERGVLWQKLPAFFGLVYRYS
ncbi:hypothetical protein OF83DRAFT_1128934 [Amylostereum chailletii]|nr:hypothetical protein OF83DRAFT_1128934 [Amylostereum chailletii]